MGCPTNDRTAAKTVKILHTFFVQKLVVIESISAVNYVLLNENLYVNKPFCSAFHALSFDT